MLINHHLDHNKMYEVSPDGKVEILFDTTNIAKFISHIAKVNNVVTAIHYLARTNDLEHFSPLETDGLPFSFDDGHGNVRVMQEDISDWIFQKAFEDLIVGLNQSLIETYSMLKIHALAKRTETRPIKTPEEFESELDKIKNKGPKLHFPALMEEIEKMLACDLSLRDEILSVNQVRNCLVHKNGIATSAFALKYVEMRMIVKKNGELLRVTKAMKKQGFSAEQLYMQSMPANRVFTAGEKITMDADVLKDVIYTGILFIHELVLKLPLPDEIKQQIVQPFTVQLAVSPTSK